MPSNRLPALAPMLAVPATLPPNEEEFAFEYKWDGMRCLARIDAEGKLRLSSRSGQDITARFPELAGIAEAVPPRTILDGEIISYGANGRPDFGRLQLRMGLLDPGTIARRAAAEPVSYLVFDAPVVEGLSLVSLSYVERRRALESLNLQGPRWDTPPSHVGIGAAMLQVSRSMGLEGIMAKRLDSAYAPGQRSPRWLKIRNRLRQEFVVGGWTTGEGGRRSSLGALLMGHYLPSGELQYVGRVGSGFDQDAIDRLMPQLRALQRFASPFGPSAEEDAGDVRWVEPRLVAEVEFSGLTGHKLLRQASFKGLRTDKPAHEVVWEQATLEPIPSAADSPRGDAMHPHTDSLLDDAVPATGHAPEEAS